jgi:hypothetical protein
VPGVVSKVFGQDPFLALLGSRIFFGSCSRAPSSSQVARSQILEWSSLSHAGALAAFLGSIFVGCSQFSSRVPSLLVWFRFQFHASILQRFSSSTDLSSLGGSEGSKCMPFWFAVLRFTLPPLQFCQQDPVTVVVPARCVAVGCVCPGLVLDPSDQRLEFL